MSTMIYRKLSPTGDYTLGLGMQGFYSDIYAVGQAILTRLLLFKGTFWLDLTDGLPMFQSILGSSGSPANIQQVDTIVSNRIIGTPHVSSIVSFTSGLNAQRQYKYTAQVQTDYSGQQIYIGNAPPVSPIPGSLIFNVPSNSQYLGV